MHATFVTQAPYGRMHLSFDATIMCRLPHTDGAAWSWGADSCPQERGREGRCVTWRISTVLCPWIVCVNVIKELVY